ncbi:SDR family oxidoreductase [Paraburkholderia sp. XV]|uniref:SDR family oxidoreductase n=1 Tax=Paraburkholderia sp. XV TaxID=2831520 RepID=UPI003990495F
MEQDVRYKHRCDVRDRAFNSRKHMNRWINHQYNIDECRQPRGILAHAATKGAFQNFTGSLAQLLAKDGIRVNCVAPGPIWTHLCLQPCREKRSRTSASRPAGRPAGRASEPDFSCLHR